jgi:hypothetical protein
MTEEWLMIDALFWYTGLAAWVFVRRGFDARNRSARSVGTWARRAFEPTLSLVARAPIMRHALASIALKYNSRAFAFGIVSKIDLVSAIAQDAPEITLKVQPGSGCGNHAVVRDALLRSARYGRQPTFMCHPRNSFHVPLRKRFLDFTSPENRG